ncbi:MAG TPA: hypothetical protein PKG90_00455 [Chitinophagaceae bacterium]|nr:hypothetical protein [Chitinophagaceae bacterium]HNU13140.1 hypothetical protein [Chitinophagaceae bacterium]
MRNLLFPLFAFILLQSANSQKPIIKTVKPYKPSVVLYEHANYSGAFKTLGPGQYALTDFNDVASSIKVPAGMVAYVYEHAAPAQGYGISVDFLEDIPDLSVYNFNDKVSYINIFYATKDNQYVWKRNALVNAKFVSGHWERKRARPEPPNTVAVVSPPIPGPISATSTVLTVNGASTTITTLGNQSLEGKAFWEIAKDQMGIIGNDYRGREEIGTACFERASNNVLIPDNLNFWYPQRPSNDHRNPFKRTLSGQVARAAQANIQGTYADFDVNIDIIPYPKYGYLVTTAHKPEFTTIMKLQDVAYDIKECPPSFDAVEAEIAEDYWPKGDHTFGRARLTDMALSRVGRGICVYGIWIYDMGHCCHPEIHPAEQLWWSDSSNNRIKSNLNVVCDASRRFWWRNQMDDGTKLKPWAEPPIKGLFAIAFEYALPNAAATASIGYNTLKFDVDYIQHYNLAEYPNANQTYNLVYNGKNIVSFVPNNNAFKVSFEHVGISPEDNNKIRGFLVIETSVGKTTQITTQAYFPGSNPPALVKLPAGSDPSQAPQAMEKLFFKKEEGHYYFTVTQSTVRNGTPVIRSVSGGQ